MMLSHFLCCPRGNPKFEGRTDEKIIFFILFNNFIFFGIKMCKQCKTNHQNSPPDSPDDFKKSKKIYKKIHITPLEYINFRFNDGYYDSEMLD